MCVNVYIYVHLPRVEALPQARERRRFEVADLLDLVERLLDVFHPPETNKNKPWCEPLPQVEHKLTKGS